VSTREEDKERETRATVAFLSKIRRADARLKKVQISGLELRKGE